MIQIHAPVLVAYLLHKAYIAGPVATDPSERNRLIQLAALLIPAISSETWMSTEAAQGLDAQEMAKSLYTGQREPESLLSKIQSEAGLYIASTIFALTRASGDDHSNGLVTLLSLIRNLIESDRAVLGPLRAQEWICDLCQTVQTVSEERFDCG